MTSRNKITYRFLSIVFLINIFFFSGLLSSAIAQPSLDGHADTDGGYTVTIGDQDGIGDVGLPTVGGQPWPADQFPSGNDLEEVRFYYDAANDRLYVGVVTPGIITDVDGDGDPDNTSAALASNSGVDERGVGGSESISVYFDIDEDGNFDIIAGISSLTGYPNFSVNAYNDFGTPGLSYGTPLPDHIGDYSPVPSASAPHFEFFISNWSQIAETLNMDDPNVATVSVNAFVGSLADDGIGEDYLLRGDLSIQIPLAGVGDRVWYDTNANGIQDNGETGVSGVEVRIYDSNDNLISTTTTDGNGEYMFIVSPGDYYIEFSPPVGTVVTQQDAGNDDEADSDVGQFSNQTPVFTLNAGDQDFSYDMGITDVASIGDYVWEDINGDGIQDSNEPGIEGVVVNLLDDQGNPVLDGNNNPITTTTGSDGSYEFSDLFPTVYIVEFELPQTALGFSPANEGSNDATDSDADQTTGRTGEISLNPGDESDTNDAGVIFPASLGDYVWEDIDGDGIQDQNEPGIEGVVVNLLDDQDNPMLDGNNNPITTTTGSDGSYEFSDLLPGNYKVEFTPPQDMNLTLKDQGGNDANDSDADTATGRSHIVNLGSGEHDPTIDAGFYFLASLGDYVWLDVDGDGIQGTSPQETPIEGVTVNLLDGSGNPTGQTTTTNNAGYYEFTNLHPGDYIVEFVPSTNLIITKHNEGPDDATDSDADQVTGRSQVVNLESNENDPSIDAGLLEPASISNFVWNDINGDGIQDQGEGGVENVVVNLLDENKQPTGISVTTDENGFYIFDDLLPGTYIVEFELLSGAHFSPPNIGGDDATDSDADITTGQTGPINLTHGENNDSVDVGMTIPASLGNFVWEDLNKNGIQDQNEPGIQGVTVELLDEQGNVLNSTTTDSNGEYIFTDLDPGNYRVRFTKPTNYIPTLKNEQTDDALDSDLDPLSGESHLVTLISNQQDFSVDAGYYRLASLGDFVWEDMNNNGVQEQGEPPIENVQVLLYDGSLNSIAFTQTNSIGYYEFTDLEPGDYIVEFVPPSSWETSTKDAGSDDALDSDPDPGNNHRTDIINLESNENDQTIDAGFYRLVVSLGNYVWDDVNRNGIQDQNENPIEGVTINLLDSNGQPTGLSRTTDENGYYEFTDIQPGDYIVEFVTPATYTPTGKDKGDDDALDSDIDSNSGQTDIISLVSNEDDTTIDAGFYQSSGIGDFVWDDLNADGIQDQNEIGIPDVTVNLLDSNGNQISTTTTDANGAYNFTDLQPGDYIVEFVTPDDYETSPQDAGNDETVDSDVDANTSRTATFTLAANSTIDHIDAGYYKLASLGNFVWEDLNADGIQDQDESGISGVTVNLLDANGQQTGRTTTTDNNGYYEFTGLIPGDYYVEFVPPPGYETSPLQSGADADLNSDANPANNHRSELVNLESGEDDSSIDAGFYRLASLGDLVWDDVNRNGIQDQNENPIEGVTVNLLYGDGQPTGQNTVTSANGQYLFSDLEPGDYIVEFITPDTFTPTIQDQGNDDENDSDANPLTGRSEAVTLISNDNNVSVDAGYYQSSGLGDFVWNDKNANGVQDQDELGIPDVTVNLLNSNGDLISSTTTTGTGYYNFNDLQPGQYIVEFVPPAGFQVSPLNAGTDDAMDSDADPNNNYRSPLIDLPANEIISDIDAGFYELGTLGDFVWDDQNGNGVQDQGESGVEGVTVNLLDENGNQLDFTNTNANGEYSFTNLEPGNYIIEIVAPQDMVPTRQDQGGNDELDSDIDLNSLRTDPIILSSGEVIETSDAGLVFLASLGDFVWIDENRNGIQDIGEDPLENVTVKLLDGSGNDLSISTITDANGYYEFLDLQPDDYIVEFVAPQNYYPTTQNVGSDDAKDSDADIASGYSGIVNLESGENDATIDAGFFLNSGLGDFVWEDLNKNGIQDVGEPGIPDVLVEYYNGPNFDELIDSDITDENGLYSFPTVNPGTYKVKVTTPNGYETTIQNQGDDAKDSDVDESTGFTDFITLLPNESNPKIDAGYFRRASLGDFVWEDLNRDGVQDQNEPGLENVRVDLLDKDGNELQTTTTLSDGSYSFTNLEPGDYIVKFHLFGDYIITQPDAGDDAIDSDADSATGETVLISLQSGEENNTIDAGMFVPPASLGNIVWLDLNANGIQDQDEPGIAGVTVNLLDGNGVATGQTAITDGSGNYKFENLVPGDYIVEFVNPPDMLFSTTDAGNDDALDSDANTNTGRTTVITLAPDENNESIDAGLYALTSLGDLVWDDLDYDGIQDQGEPGIKDVTVNLLDSLGNPTGQSTTTDDNGIYSFENLVPGKYIVEFVPANNYVFSYNDEGSNDEVDSDADRSTGKSEPITLQSGQSNSSIDAGMFIPTASLGSTVWLDLNANGLQDQNEPGLEGVTVNLLNGDGNPTGQSILTDENGNYIFRDLIPGDYIVEFKNPDNMQNTIPNTGSDDNLDSDANPATGRSDKITLGSQENNLTIDAGFYEFASIGDYVWNDINYNGIQDQDELPVENVTVNLIDSTGNVVATTTTDETGKYIFTNVIPGDYQIEFVMPDGFSATQQGQGENSSQDSDINPTDNRTEIISISSGEYRTNIDGGILELGSIGDFIWHDTNGNGSQDANEPGLENVVVNLYEEDGTTLFATQSTDENGRYLFEDVPPGKYFIEVDETTLPEFFESTTGDLPAEIDLNTGQDYEDGDFGYMPPPPIADFTSDVTSGVGEVCVSFENLSQYANEYEWDFGDGTTSSEENPVHCFSNPPLKYYTVTLTVHGPGGSDSITKEKYIVVHKTATVAFSATPIVGIPGTEVNFTNETGGSANKFTWNFGDGTTEHHQHNVMNPIHPKHVYENEGKFTVSLSGEGHGGTDYIEVKDLIYIDKFATTLELVDQSETLPGEGWENAINNDVTSSSSNVQAINNDAWAIFTFANMQAKMIHKVRLLANNAFGSRFNNHLTKDFEIYVSMDGEDYELGYSGSLVTKNDWEVFEFEPITAKYLKLKLVNARGSSSPYITLGEFQVFGTNAATASLQIIHNAADPALDTVDVYVDDMKILDDFSFRSASSYLMLPADENITVGFAGSNSTSAEQALTTFELTLDDSMSYVAVASGVLNVNDFEENPEGEDISLNLILSENAQRSATVSGNFEFTLLNGVTDAPALDIYAGLQVADDVEYGRFTNYVGLPASNYFLTVTNSNGTNVYASAFAQMSGFADSAAVVFTSGFLNPSLNQDGNGFAILAAFPNGNVVELATFTQFSPSQMTSILGDLGLLPTEYSLSQNYPNPFNPETTIEYQLPEHSEVTLTVFNMMGQQVVKLVNSYMEAGIHQAYWNGQDKFGSQVSSGIYFYSIEIRGLDSGKHFRSLKKMTLLK